MKAIFKRGHGLGLQLFLLVGIAFTLMILDYHTSRVIYLRQALSVVVTPFQYAVHVPIQLVQRGREQLRTRQGLLEDNQALRNEYRLLQSKLQKLAVLEQENARLRHLLNSPAVVISDEASGDKVNREKVLVAELLQTDADPTVHRLVLNKGQYDGVFIGQAVLDADGVMGQIVEIGPMTSVALLITDISHSLPVENQRNGMRAVITGTGDWNELELNHITPTMDLRAGDLIVTSGLGQRFIRGYPVGTVTSIAAEEGLAFLRVKVKPAAQLDTTREVLLIWPQEVKADSAPSDEE